MPFLGMKSGFRSLRDVILFGTGLFIDLYHILTTAPSELSVKVMVFGATLAGAPTVFRKDSQRYDDGDDNESRYDSKKRRRASDADNESEQGETDVDDASEEAS